MGNYHSAWSDGVTLFNASSMNPALASLDKAITYGTKRPIVHCDGVISWYNGTLAWSGTIRILFVSQAGNTIQNTISSGSTTINDNEFCYVTLNEADGTALTISKAAITTDAASNFVTDAIFVLAYRNTTNDSLYSVGLPVPNAAAVMLSGQQSITCADNVTVNWALGQTAYMTFDRATVNMTFSNPTNGQCYRILAIQGAGSQAFAWTTTIKWKGGSPPTLTASAGAQDILIFTYINSTWYGEASLNYA